MSQFQQSKQEERNIVDLDEQYTNSKLTKSEKKKIEMEGKNTGHWNTTEKLQYLEFLKTHRPNFVKKQLRRTDKIFKQMSKSIDTRAADQCRSHHQKMQKKYGSFDAIVEVLKDDYCLKLAMQTFKLPLQQETKVHTPVCHNPSFEINEDKLFLGQNEEENFLSMNLNGNENDIDLNHHSTSLFSMDDPVHDIFQQSDYFMI